MQGKILKGVLKGVVIVSLVAALLIGAGYFRLQKYMNTPLQITGQGMEYVLVRGSSLSALAYTLSKKGVLQTPRWLILYSKVSGVGANIKAGEYFFPAGLTPKTLLEKVEAGEVREYQVTLVEGWTVQQAYSALHKQKKLKKLLGQSWQDRLTKKITVREQTFSVLEGLFFPDTYQYSSEVSDEDILIQAYQRLQTVLNEEWEKRDSALPYNNPYDALIMASLIEKETGQASERTRISGVFVRRLNKGMRLQTDPAVIYGLGAQFNGNLRSKHLKDKTNLYNTYRHHGLPPSPIALVGREAIYAALHPAQGKALYFVAKGDGSHYFSDTLEEHRRAVRKYQITQRRKDYSSAPQIKKTLIN
jgi:peptidoglycan lytic transglycosylase G